MADLIDRKSAIDEAYAVIVDDAVYDVVQVETLEALPTVDAVEIVRCKDCKHRWVNEHYGEKGYMKIKAMCSLDTDDPFELGRNAYDDNWFCADGERKDD